MEGKILECSRYDALEHNLTCQNFQLQMTCNWNHDRDKNTVIANKVYQIVFKSYTPFLRVKMF